MTGMPLRPYSGPLAPLNDHQLETRDALHAHLRNLTANHAERNIATGRPGLEAAADYIMQRLRGYGYEVRVQPYTVAGVQVRNLVAQKTGIEKPDEVMVVGAHYDSANGSPGADDNASGVAALIQLAYLFKDRTPARSIQFVFFTNEEPPYFHTTNMGSTMYARWLRHRKADVIGMISLECLGVYSDAPHSQRYPAMLGPLYGDKADFIAFVGNLSSRGFVRRMVQAFRVSASFPSEGIAAPESFPWAGWSDHWSFWEEDYPAVMVTDTASYRYQHYHKATDTVDKLDIDRMARVVSGLDTAISDLASGGTRP